MWGCEVPAKPGLTFPEMIEAIHSGSIKAMYIMGENPVFNFIDSAFVKDSLEKLDFLVVQDIFMTETAGIADVVFPSLAWAEKEGTFTNLERRIQKLRKAIDRQGMEDWKILCELGKKMGIVMEYESFAAITNEISAVSQLHGGLTPDDLERGMDLWPYKGEPLRRRPGSGGWPLMDAWVPEKGEDLYLSLERHMFLSGTMSRYSAALNSIYQEPCAKMSPATAWQAGIGEGDLAEVKSKRGRVVLPVRVEKDVPEYVILLTNNFKDKGAMSLIPWKIDSAAKVPCLNGIHVTITGVHRYFERGGT